ncbi:hypothetical protein [Streptococcus lutetiensis]|uniref:hypothetical protein n=1 Tax=Streptococcus lutetiensis TaxID=150055 RepID=UPI000DA33C87|nr:hypothetical protein [Streptococcus lutetiensis]MBT0906342.1 hypothetical protein [Streptococcus lutetiensis]MCY7162189.1 hypothetical protein [Streptococcus lutetiensis]QQT06621.1 hypothetical protein I6J15_05375 [Streptococcus lutetiensis]SQG57584.1 cell shape-determining protein [Streptococcus lutetiensis]VTS99379.1 cell shape-determining protein [Streptococcus lutetiensis]
MKKTVSYWLIALWFLVMLISYWIFLPPINIFSVAFWLFVLEGLALAFGGLALLSLGGKVQQVTFQMTGSRARKVVSAPRPTFGKALSAISFAIAAILLILGASTFLNSRLFRAKSYANVIKVKDADFASDFPETDISHLALLDRSSAKKIGDTYLGTIDKVSQFGISDDYRQVTIGEQPYRVSPLEYKSFWKWFSNHKDGIGYYVKVNQTTGKAALVKLDKGMKYSDSEYFFNDTLRYLRLKYPTVIFGDPSFEVDDKGNPYYVATTYKPKFMLTSNDPTGAILLNAVTGETKRYDLNDVPKWVDRVFSANNVISRVDDYYTYQKGFWNTVFSQTDVKKITDSYNYISIGSDIYLYTGITSATADSSNLGFILVNMRTREVTNYKLASATETAAQESAEGEVQEKHYEATAPTLVKLDGKAYYLVSLKDAAGLVKSYAIVDAEDYQQVTVDNDIETLITKFTDSDTSALSGVADNSGEAKKVKVITGVVDKLASQMISGSTVYYISSSGEIYKVKATTDTTDKLPFLAVGDEFKGELQDDNYLTKFEVTNQE